MSDDRSRESAAGRDPEIERTEAAKSSAASLFDIRRIIGGLFTLYGVIVLVAGLFDGADAKEKASGIDINIWTGLGDAAARARLPGLDGLQAGRRPGGAGRRWTGRTAGVRTRRRR